MSADTSRDKYLEFLKKAATADSETDLNGLFAIFEPEGKTRAEMGEAFNEALGYNPITHFDVEELSGVMETVLEHADPDFISAVKPKRRLLINRAMEIYDVERTETLKRCLAKAGKELLDEDLGRALSETLLGHDLDDEEPAENNFEGLDDDDEGFDSLTDTMKDIEDENSGLSPSDLDDDMDFGFDDEED